MAGIGPVKADDLIKNVTLEVEITGVRVLRARIWLAMRLLLIVGKVLGVGRIEVKGGGR